MLLCVDVGNSHTVYGLYEGASLLHHWRVHTDREQTADEYGLDVVAMLQWRGIDPRQVQEVAITCVVPPLLPDLVAMARQFFGAEPLVVSHETDIGMINRYRHPQEVGADRLVNAVGAAHKYRLPAIVVDFGTATTFDVVSAKREYLGGAIMPGVGISLDALFQRASRLPRIDLRPPASPLGQDTVSSIQAGVLYGTAGAVDALCRHLRASLEGEPIVIATGGLAPVIAPLCQEVHVTDPLLTLDGLWAICQRQKQAK